MQSQGEYKAAKDHYGLDGAQEGEESLDNEQNSTYYEQENKHYKEEDYSDEEGYRNNYEIDGRVFHIPKS